MNIQNLMREAQKMQGELQKVQKELENTTYEGESSLVKVKINGKKELLEININMEENIEKDEKELLEDMIMVAINEAGKKANSDKEQKMGKYGQGLNGLI